MKFFNKLFKKEAPPTIAPSKPFDEISTVYALTEEGLVGLVEGRLSCESSEKPGTFFVYYDTIVFDTEKNKLFFSWQGVNIMSIDLPIVTIGNTLTINGLQGKVPMEIR